MSNEMVSTGDTDLVATYDLPDSESTGGFFIGGGYSRVNFGHLKSDVFSLGGYSRVNFGHLKSKVFHWGGGGLSGLKIPERSFLENLDTNFTV